MINIEKNQRVDWFKVIVDIEREGYSHRRISRETQIPKTTIIGWKNLIARPKYEEAVYMINFWSSVCKKSTADVPIYNHYNS